MAAGAALALAADQALKSWCAQSLRLYERFELAGRWLSLTRNPNRGIAHGYFSNVPTGHIELYIRYIPTAVWASMAGFTLFRWKAADRIERFGWTFALAGGASNLLSHWRSEWVLDTLAVPNGLGYFLVFNVADFALCVGAALVGLSLLRAPKPSFPG